MNELTMGYRFKKAKVVAPLYTGGPVAIAQDGTRLVTCVGEEAILTDVKNGKEICRFAGVRDNIPACSPTSLLFFSFYCV